MLDEIIQWRRDFHKEPELEFRVEKTAARVARLLNSFNIKVCDSIGQTGLVGILSCGTSDRAIGLRADMDALPITEANPFDYQSTHAGMMHACGHDGHMAMLLGAAFELSQTRDFNGTVYFIFQPNEERGLGAQAMIDDGLFTQFPMTQVFGMHNMPGIEAGKLCLREGPIMGAEDNFKIKIKGVGGHSSAPHKAIDPIVIGAQVVNALQTLPSRVIDPLEPVVVSVTDFKTNGHVNILASEVEITGDCRSFNEGVQDSLSRQMGQIVKGICDSYGADYDYEYKKVFFPTVNSSQGYQAAKQAALAVSGADAVDVDCKPITASEDFSSMLRVKSGAYILIGNGLDSKGGCMLHTPDYDFNDEIISKGVAYWTTLVRQQLA